MSGAALWTRISNFCGILRLTTVYRSISWRPFVLMALSGFIKLHPSPTQFTLCSPLFVCYDAQFSAQIYQQSRVLRISYWISAHPKPVPQYFLIWNKALVQDLPDHPKRQPTCYGCFNSLRTVLQAQAPSMWYVGSWHLIQRFYYGSLIKQAISMVIYSALASDNLPMLHITSYRFQRPLNLPDRRTIPLPTSYHNKAFQNVAPPALSVLGRCLLYLDVTCAHPSVLCWLSGYFGNLPSTNCLSLDLAIYVVPGQSLAEYSKDWRSWRSNCLLWKQAAVSFILNVAALPLVLSVSVIQRGSVCVLNSHNSVLPPFSIVFSLLRRFIRACFHSYHMTNAFLLHTFLLPAPHVTCSSQQLCAVCHCGLLFNCALLIY